MILLVRKKVKMVEKKVNEKKDEGNSKTFLYEFARIKIYQEILKDLYHAFGRYETRSNRAW